MGNSLQVVSNSHPHGTLQPAVSAPFFEASQFRNRIPTSGAGLEGDLHLQGLAALGLHGAGRGAYGIRLSPMRRCDESRV